MSKTVLEVDTGTRANACTGNSGLMPKLTRRLHDDAPKAWLKKKNFTSFGQPTRLITGANHGNTVICS